MSRTTNLDQKDQPSHLEVIEFSTEKSTASGVSKKDIFEMALAFIPQIQVERGVALAQCAQYYSTKMANPLFNAATASDFKFENFSSALKEHKAEVNTLIDEFSVLGIIVLRPSIEPRIRLKAAAELLQAGADANWISKANGGATLLMQAVVNDEIPLAYLLISYITLANINWFNQNSGYTVLHLVVSKAINVIHEARAHLDQKENIEACRYNLMQYLKMAETLMNKEEKIQVGSSIETRKARTDKIAFEDHETVQTLLMQVYMWLNYLLHERNKDFMPFNIARTKCRDLLTQINGTDTDRMFSHFVLPHPPLKSSNQEVTKSYYPGYIPDGYHQQLHFHWFRMINYIKAINLGFNCIHSHLANTSISTLVFEYWRGTRHVKTKVNKVDNEVKVTEVTKVNKLEQAINFTRVLSQNWKIFDALRDKHDPKYGRVNPETIATDFFAKIRKASGDFDESVAKIIIAQEAFTLK